MVKEALDAQGGNSWAKTSGASGLHLLVGIEPEYEFEEVHTWAIAIDRVLVGYVVSLEPPTQSPTGSVRQFIFQESLSSGANGLCGRLRTPTQSPTGSVRQFIFRSVSEGFLCRKSGPWLTYYNSRGSWLFK